MKALIASGGRGTRRRPITHTRDKHLIPRANKPILHYAIEAVTSAGIKDIDIVVGADSDEVPTAIGVGSRWGARITFVPQATPGGLAQVVALAEPAIGKEKCGQVTKTRTPEKRNEIRLMGRPRISRAGARFITVGRLMKILRGSAFLLPNSAE